MNLEFDPNEPINLQNIKGRPKNKSQFKSFNKKAMEYIPLTLIVIDMFQDNGTSAGVGAK